MIIKPKTKSELADEYGISTKTFRIWLNDPYVLDKFRTMRIPHTTHRFSIHLRALRRTVTHSPATTFFIIQDYKITNESGRPRG